MARIMAVDPSTKSGVVCMDTFSTDSIVLVDRKIIHFDKETGHRRLQLIAKAFRSMVADWQPTVGCVEGYAFANKHTLATLVEIGTIVRLSFIEAGIPVIEVRPTTLKKLVTGNGSAKKEEMAKAVKSRWGFTSESNDVVDAYALARVAVSHLYSTSPTVGVTYHG